MDQPPSCAGRETDGSKGETSSMKRASGLYDKICDSSNIALAHQNARRGKRHYREVIMVDGDQERYLGDIHKMLANRGYRTSTYDVFDRKERGKVRTIYKLPYYPDRIVHHAIMQVLEPVWRRVFIRDTYASMKGRGIHDGVRRMKEFLMDEEGTRYCLKLDVRKFYPSINHDILKVIIRRTTKGGDTLTLLDELIDSAPGVPIGNYVSQYFANLYLAYFDHWIKEDIKVRYYARYCDDMVMLNAGKGWLHALREKIQGYLWTHLRLKLKANWQVFPTRVRGIDFLGYRFFGSHTLIRKRIVQDFKRKVRGITNHGRMYGGDLNSLMSYFGWLKHGNARNLWQKHTAALIPMAEELSGRLDIRNPMTEVMDYGRLCVQH
jgi:hypothetical protein